MSTITNAYIVGNNKVGSVIRVSVIADSSPITAEYQWYRSSIYDGVYEEIIGENNNNYTINLSDQYIKCKVIGTGDFDGSVVFTNILVIDQLDAQSISKEKAESEIASIGQGLSLSNLVSQVSGSSGTVTDIDRINQSIRIILSTAPGEVPMLPSLGCNIHQLLFGGTTEDDLDLIKYEVESALADQEPRIQVTDVTVSYDDWYTVYITVEYIITDTNIKSQYIHEYSSESEGDNYE